MTGIELSSEAISLFNTFKLRNGGRFLTLKIDKQDGRTQVITDIHCELKEDNWDAFVEALKTDDNSCRYGFYKIDFQVGSQQRGKLVCFLCSPSQASVKSRMVYATTLNSVKTALSGIHKTVQVGDPETIDREEIIEELQQKAR